MSATTLRWIAIAMMVGMASQLGAEATPTATPSRASARTPLPALEPSPPYADRDRAARQPSMQELGFKGHMDLEAVRERAEARGKQPNLWALIGQMEHLGGDRATAEESYQRAVDAAGDKVDKLRHVLWSRGWARLYSGDNLGAFSDWRDAARLHGGKPSWYPHTLALAYWRAGQRPEALRWLQASEIAALEDSRERLPHLGLPLIAQSLIGDMLTVRWMRGRTDTPRLPDGAPELSWPAYVARPPPTYSRSAVTARRQGRVMTAVCVDARGKVAAQHVHRSSGHADLDQAAIAAIAGWQFRPLVCGGKQRDSWVLVPVEFAISGGGAPTRRNRGSVEPVEDRCSDATGLDEAGYTVVAASCESNVTCTSESVLSPETCGIGSRPVKR